MFGIFYDVGYKGMYVGCGCEVIKVYKGILVVDNLMDWMNVIEFVVNQFCMMQICDKLVCDGVWIESCVIDIYCEVGWEVCVVILKIGGMMFEDILVDEYIKLVQKCVKLVMLKLVFDGGDVVGLFGGKSVN